MLPLSQDIVDGVASIALVAGHLPLTIGGERIQGAWLVMTVNNSNMIRQFSTVLDRRIA
jgi:hypothetical protein